MILQTCKECVICSANEIVLYSRERVFSYTDLTNICLVLQRMSRYMNRFYGLSKDATQKLLDLAVEDNLVKLENKVGTKGTKSGVEEKAYRWPTLDMLPRERHDWYCFHCHSGGEVVLCGDCHR